MSWNEIRKEFKSKYAGYTVKICPPCISVNRQGEYIIAAMKEAINNNPSPRITIDPENKQVIYNR